MTLRLATSTIAAVITAFLTLTGAGQAAWRVVGPGMAVAEARSGNASMAAECLGDGLVLGVYEKTWQFDHEAPLTLTIDKQSFTVRQYGSGDRIILSDADSKGGNLDISAKLRAALKSGKEARLEGPVVGHIEPREITFGLLGSEKAIRTVERFCK
jgi:hypothetical protein